MATGDQADILSRLKAVLPAQWFPDDTPILDALLNGVATACAWTYSQLLFVRQQARRLTASGIYLDLISADFFGGKLPRELNESDAAFSTRIGINLFREKGTRAGVIKALEDLTGRTPTVFEPAYPLDAGGYGSAGMAAGSGLGYGVAGGYGNLQLPYQFFLTVYRPHGNGVANVAGYYYGSGWAGGGYGVGAIEYVSTDMIAGQVTDTMIYDAINDTRPADSIAWTHLSN